MDAVLRDCLVFCITFKRIELQTWGWSSFEDIYEKSMQNCNAESQAAKCSVDPSSGAFKDQNGMS